MPTLYDSQFDLDAALVLVYSSIKEVPFDIKIDFNVYQKKRIIDALIPYGSKPRKGLEKEKERFLGIRQLVETKREMDAKIYSGKNEYRQIKKIHKESHSFHNEMIKRIRNSKPLTCQQFQRLCRVVRLGVYGIDSEHPTPNEESIMHLLAEAGKELFDLKDMNENEIEAWTSGHAKILLKMVQS